MCESLAEQAHTGGELSRGGKMRSFTTFADNTLTYTLTYSTGATTHRGEKSNIVQRTYLLTAQVI